MQKTIVMILVFLGMVIIGLNMGSGPSFDDFINSMETFKAKEIVVRELPLGERYEGIMNFKNGDFLGVLSRCSYREVDQSNHEEVYEIRLKLALHDIKIKVLDKGMIEYDSKYYALDADSYEELRRAVNFYIMVEKYGIWNDL